MDDHLSRRTFLSIGLALCTFFTFGACATTTKSNQKIENEKLKELRSKKIYRETHIEVGDNYFKPKEITIKPGTIVIWTNKGNFLHDIIWDDASDSNKDLDFSSNPLKSDEIHVHLFTDPGTYYYHCHFHGGPQRGQWGLITVKA